MMNFNEKIHALKQLLRNCPEVLTPRQASKCSPLGKNKIYELIKKGELRAFIYQNSYIIAKADLIEYLAAHADDEGKKHFKIHGDDES